MAIGQTMIALRARREAHRIATDIAHPQVPTASRPPVPVEEIEPLPVLEYSQRPSALGLEKSRLPLLIDRAAFYLLLTFLIVLVLIALDRLK
jgi:hypothetical protein